jgi:hypothetical protein
VQSEKDLTNGADPCRIHIIHKDVEHVTEGKLTLVPLSLREANAFVQTHHRHHKPVRGHKFAIGAQRDDRLVGAVIVGRPVARAVNHRKVAEVTRLVTDGSRHVCSFLYAAAARAAKAMGYQKVQTYILESEPGTSLVAAGWKFEAKTAGGDWNCNVRKSRRTDQPMAPKQRWSKEL